MISVLMEVLDKRGFPQKIINFVRDMCRASKVSIVGDYNGSSAYVSPVLLNIYNWHDLEAKDREFLFYNITYVLNKSPNTLPILFVDDQAIISYSEDSVQKAVCALNMVVIECDLEISVSKNKAMTFRGNELVRSNILIVDRIIEQFTQFLLQSVLPGGSECPS